MADHVGRESGKVCSYTVCNVYYFCRTVSVCTHMYINLERRVGIGLDRDRFGRFKIRFKVLMRSSII